mmetsp:Transcript_26642/g.27008  ORF Transcript_26642/g.27008 Transcript_26642/m.27008 type:complete len:146 (-) Transcript_26642:32-469(-)
MQRWCLEKRPSIRRDDVELALVMQQWKPVCDTATRKCATMEHNKCIRDNNEVIAETTGVCSIILQLKIPEVKQVTQMECEDDIDAFVFLLLLLYNRRLVVVSFTNCLISQLSMTTLLTIGKFPLILFDQLLLFICVLVEVEVRHC